jgi:hypothetical protein
MTIVLLVRFDCIIKVKGFTGIAVFCVLHNIIFEIFFYSILREDRCGWIHSILDSILSSH